MQPVIHCLENTRRVGKSEVCLPSSQVAPELRYHLGETASAPPARDLPDPLLHCHQGLRRHSTLDHPARGIPEAVAEELGTLRRSHRTLGCVDLEMKFAYRLTKPCITRSPARLDRTYTLQSSA